MMDKGAWEESMIGSGGVGEKMHKKHKSVSLKG